MIIDHKPQPYTFSFTPFLRQTYHHGISPDQPICKAYLAGHCPNGSRCPDRHTAATSAASGAGGSSGPSLVCKHWLRGLCKKGATCEFLHEYNLRKMPECNFFMRNGYCSNGEECLYLHIDPQTKLPPCPHYDQGFCPLGPNCSKKHVRRKLCSFYLAGFCPDGPDCKEGAHPKWQTDLENPTVKVEKEEDDAQTQAMAGLRKEGGERDEEWERPRENRDGNDGRHRHGRGGGKWRGRGDRRFRGRGH
jgi:cleavage and polyadenylation specificity factor subunit 4